MSNEFWNDVFRLVDEYDKQRPKVLQEYRLYYDNDGNVIGLWETGHPDGDNYIVLDNPGIFNHTNTSLLKIKDKKLVVLSNKASSRTRLKKGSKQFPVVAGYASLVIEINEDYPNIEYYERTNS